MYLSKLLLALLVCSAVFLAGCKADPSTDEPAPLSNTNNGGVGSGEPVEEDPLPEPPPTVPEAPEPPAPGPVSSVLSDPNYLPFNPAPRALLSDSPKKVFAHYFTPYPLSINNKVPDEEYYRVNYLNPFGENSKFLSKGGLLRQKPLDRAPIPQFEAFRITDMRQELRMAAQMGIDGFAVNILSDSGTHWERTKMMLDLAAEEFDDFYVLIMPDMQSLKNHDNFVNMIKQLANKPAAFRLDDGRLVIAPYLAENLSPQWWVTQVDLLQAQGIDVALWPVYQGWGSDLDAFINAFPTRYRDILYGVSDWGPRSAEGGANLIVAADSAHSKDVLWMAPVAPQDMRPKSSIFTEAGNSQAIRNMWMSAIDGGADWVQLISWNDYSEATEVSPSTRTRFGFFDLSAYYTHWFKLGKPKIERDTIYAYYREHHTQTPLMANALQTDLMKAVNGASPKDEIEMLAFLTAPATLEIEINGNVYQRQADEEGMTRFAIPIQNGRPVFRIIRDGESVESMDGAWEITSQIEVQNLIYNGMSSRRLAPSDNQTVLSWPWRFGNFSSMQSLKSVEAMSPFSRASNFSALSYVDPKGNENSGFGFSFVNPDPNALLNVGFDFYIDASRAGNFSYEMRLADSNLNIGAVMTIGGGAVGGARVTNLHEDTKKIISSVILNSNQWYRAEMIVDGINNINDKYKVKVTSTDGRLISTISIPFNRNLNNLSNLIFVSEKNDNNATRLVVDNVQVTSG